MQTTASQTFVDLEQKVFAMRSNIIHAYFRLVCDVRLQCNQAILTLSLFVFSAE